MKPKHTLLVVDDEPDVVKSVQDLLRFDFRVLGARSGAEGLEVLKREEVHVVMTDQRMPEMSGVELLHRVRGEHPEAIRLLFTGYADIRAVIDAINQGNVYRYVVKPWDPDELVSILREAVERYDLVVERTRLTHELELRNAELARSDALKEAFIRVASHELRGPTTILLALAQQGVRAAAADDPMRAWHERILRATERLRHLVDQTTEMLMLGDYARPLVRAHALLDDVLVHAADDVRPFAELRRQTLAIEIAPGDYEADIDAPKIRDCVNQLLFNAVKFTPDGGTITLRARPSAPPETGFVIEVIDRGIGIDEESRKALFTPFFTSFDVWKHSSGKFEFNTKGLGLGLSVVRGFVTMHGGAIEVESAPGQGSTFRIALP
jgi:signal transduction histidine kinase